jgi:hypothetical protein
MKAIIQNKETFKVTGERGDFFICENSKGKCKMFFKSDVEVIEIDSFEVKKVNKTKKVNKANFMTNEEFSKSKYSTMSKCDFEKERENDRFKTI